MGMDFGIWVEPEMVNPNSDLYRTHPDWIFYFPNRPKTLGRSQFMLNLAREDVCQYLYKSLSTLLREHNIKYLKWDMNRHLTDLGSVYLGRENQMELSHRYVLGLYHVMETLTERFPQVLFESCSSGGGRFDAGMLYYMPQTWTSDNTDAICRLKIQHGTSFLFPRLQWGLMYLRVQIIRWKATPLATRFAVAAAGNLGYELDLKKSFLKKRKRK